MTDPHPKAKIFPAEARDRAQTMPFSTYRIFNHIHHQPGGVYTPLSEFNDDYIAADHSVIFKAADAKILFLLPIRGSLTCVIRGLSREIRPGMFFIHQLAKGEAVKITNTYARETANYIRVLTDTDRAFPVSTDIRFFHAEAPSYKADLAILYQVGHPSIACSFKKIAIGKLSSRAQTNYVLQNDVNIKCLLYVISGEALILGKSLHCRDGLMLWNAGLIKLEARHPDALILLMEYGYADKIC